jgi:hypothetical protein
MDPVYITSEDWRDIGNLLTFIWLILLFAIGFGFNFLMAHAIIPSLIGSGHLPQRLNKARRIFYGGAFGALSLMVFAVGRAIVEAQFIEDIWGRWWI